MFEYLYFTFKIPYKFKCKKHIRYRKSYSYKVLYEKRDGSFITQYRSKLPRITEFPDYYQLRLNQYIGCSNGFGWVIKDIELIRY